MEYKLINKNTYVLKISRGENVLESIRDCVNKNNILFAKINGIGAIKNISIGFLQKTGEYKTKYMHGEYELLSINGNVAGDKKIHLHAVVSDKNFNVFGGHFFDAIVTGVIEMFITILSKQKIFKYQNKNDLFPTWKLN